MKRLDSRLWQPTLCVRHSKRYLNRRQYHHKATDRSAVQRFLTTN